MVKYNIIIVAFLCLLLASPIHGQIIVDERAILIPDRDDTAQVNAEVSFIVDIDEYNMETGEYVIEINNSVNYSIEGYIEIYMEFIPETIEVLVDGEKADIITQEESYTNSRYRVKIDIAPESDISVEVDYKILKTPQQWNVGLWALQYHYNSPINMQFSSREEDYIRTYSKYDGKITLGYEPSKLSCSSCISEGKTITVEDSDYFYVNWEKKRVPYRAGILYLVMIFGIMYYLVKKSR